jgi:hypothetical protein
MKLSLSLLLLAAAAPLSQAQFIFPRASCPPSPAPIESEEGNVEPCPPTVGPAAYPSSDTMISPPVRCKIDGNMLTFVAL